jgi:hypothetical protein
MFNIAFYQFTIALKICHKLSGLKNTSCTKLKSKWIKELHIKPETLKLIEEKVGKSLEYMGTGGKFLNRTAMACAVIDISIQVYYFLKIPLSSYTFFQHLLGITLWLYITRSLTT